jgi:HPt (histidine-containing phosphotransfer) domain-containing protein
VASYVRLLNTFAESHAGDMPRLRDYLDAGDLQQAERIIHSLKGASATLGATRIRALSNDLEKAIREQHEDKEIRRLHQLLDGELLSLIAGIRRIPDDKPALRPFKAEQIQQVLEKLKTLLAEDNIQANEVLHLATPLLRTGLGNRFDELEYLIGNFDYEKALALLNQPIPPA